MHVSSGQIGCHLHCRFSATVAQYQSWRWRIQHFTFCWSFFQIFRSIKFPISIHNFNFTEIVVTIKNNTEYIERPWGILIVNAAWYRTVPTRIYVDNCFIPMFAFWKKISKKLWAWYGFNSYNFRCTGEAVFRLMLELMKKSSAFVKVEDSCRAIFQTPAPQTPSLGANKYLVKFCLSLKLI